MAVIYQKELAIKHRCDVCVVGAGPAGIAAAIAAARQGQSVMLFESLAMPGGMSTAALVPVLMPWTDGDNVLCGGIGKEIIDRAQATGAMRGGAIYAERLKRLYEVMLLEAGVVISYTTKLIDVIMRDKHIDLAIFNAKSGTFAVKAQRYVDASGDGDLAAMAGAPYEIGDTQGRMMPGTLCSLWAGVDWQEFRLGGAFSHNDDNMLALLRKAVAEGMLSQEDYHLTGMTRTSDNVITGNLSHCFGINPLDELSMTTKLIENRRVCAEYERFFRTYIRGFANAEIAATGAVMGVRESRRITGDYVLNADDYQKRATFPDEIGRYNFGIDIHPAEPGGDASLAEHKKQYIGQHYRRGESYGIPYRVLCPQQVENVLCAGRCVSTDRAVMASLRVIPGCWITGMAAGTAAAMSIAQDCTPRALPARTLQQQLKRDGAFLPNFNA